MKSNVKPMPVPGMPAAPDTGTLKGFLRFLWLELKPRGKVLTPFNIITGIIILGGSRSSPSGSPGASAP